MIDDDQKRAMLADLEASGVLSAERRLRQPGDLDSEDMARHLGVGERWAFDQMKRIAREKPEEWVTTLVYDPIKKHQLMVLRKVEEK